MDKALTQIQKNLESIKKTSDDREMMEFWSARDLMAMLGYIKWQKFIEVIGKAKEACKKSNQSLENHFLPVPVKSSGGRPRSNKWGQVPFSIKKRILLRTVLSKKRLNKKTKLGFVFLLTCYLQVFV